VQSARGQHSAVWPVLILFPHQYVMEFRPGLIERPGSSDGPQALEGLDAGRFEPLLQEINAGSVDSQVNRVYQQVDPAFAAMMKERHQRQFFKTKICKFWENNQCQRGSSCVYAHGAHELCEAPNLEKTALCFKVLKGGTCSNPDCKFAHSVVELRASVSKAPFSRIPRVGRAGRGLETPSRSERLEAQDSFDEVKQPDEMSDELGEPPWPRLAACPDAFGSPPGFWRQQSEDSARYSAVHSTSHYDSACSASQDPFTPESRGQRQGFGRQVSDFQPAHSAFDRQISAPAGLNLEGTQSKFTKASADQAMKDAAQLKTEARREAQAIHTNRTRKRRHVVISPKFQEPFFYFSVLLKVILQMLGCTVYNPNTDNEETYKEEANGLWLRTFNENLELVKKTEGFVLQLQGNKWAEKSHMQWAEEKQSGWLDVPRIGIWLSWSSNYMGYTYLLKRLVNAIQKADGQWATDRAEGVVMCNEVYEGQRNAEGKPHGYGKVTFPTGDVYEGNWENGWRSGHGRSTFASGDIYEGNWENSKFSGHGKFAYASGAIYEGNWKNGKRNGQGKHTSASGVVQDGEWKDGNFKG